MIYLLVDQRRIRTLTDKRPGLDHNTTDGADYVVEKARGDDDMALLLTIAGEDPLHSSAVWQKPILGLASARLGTLDNYQPFDCTMLLCSFRMHGAIQDCLSVP